MLQRILFQLWKQNRLKGILRPSFVTAIWAISLSNTLVIGPAKAEEGIVPAKELFITHLSVVDDARASAGGPWSLSGALVRISPDHAPELLKQWLSSWATTILNG